MATNPYCLSTKTARWRRLIISAGFAFAAALLLSLATSAPAKADCGSVQECDLEANLYRLMATERFHQGVLYNAAGDQAAARGELPALFMYRKAAGERFNEAQILNIASGNSLQRYVFFANLPECGAQACAAGSGETDPNNRKSWGTRSFEKAKAICGRSWQTWIACTAVEYIVVEGVRKYIWNIRGAQRHCVRQRAFYLPDAGYPVVRHECTKWA